MTDKPKFKQTEVGMIPSDWEVKTLGELVDMSSGTTPSRFNEKNFQGNVCWLSSGELKSHYIYNTKEKISEDAASSMRLYPKGTVVIAMYGLEAEGVRGTSSILAKECTISQACMAFTNLREINNEYFYYWYAANGNEIGTKYAQGTKQQNLSPEVMKNVIIPLPPTIEEQQRIANALSDVDTLIANLEKLIAKKKNIKQGAMQQLLTGKIRLDDFSEKWIYVKIKDIFRVTRGYVLNSSLVSPFCDSCTPYPVFSSQTSNKGVMGYYRSYLYENAITWTTDGANAGDVNYRDGRFYCTNVCGVLLSDKGFANECIAGILSLCSKSYVSYVGNPKLMNNVMAEIEILIPPSLEEQTAIANVLSDMDTEIATLEIKLAKCRKLKTGMMQQLLTGKIRLV